MNADKQKIKFKGLEVESFLDYCRRVRPSLTDYEDVYELVDDFVDLWHESGGMGRGLDEALGIFGFDYQLWLSDARYMISYLREVLEEMERPGEEDLIPGYRFIVQRSDYLGGEPALLGIRMRPVDFIRMLAGGWTEERLQKEYELTREQFREIYRYAVQKMGHGSAGRDWTKRRCPQCGEFEFEERNLKGTLFKGQWRDHPPGTIMVREDLFMWVCRSCGNEGQGGGKGEGIDRVLALSIESPSEVGTVFKPEK